MNAIFCCNIGNAVEALYKGHAWDTKLSLSREVNCFWRLY